MQMLTRRQFVRNSVGATAALAFAASGRVINVSISGGSFNGTSVGSCVAGVFRRAKIPSFNGGSVTVAKSFTIPK